jgi:poly(3-hydroxybutyrate) depolymerase
MGHRFTLVGGERVPVHIVPVWERPFCRLLHFERALEHAPKRPQPKLLIVAPMSGPLRDAAARHGRGVPAEPRRLHHRVGRRPHGAARGRALRSRRLHRLRDLDAACARRRDHIVGVCQPSVPVLAAVACMEAKDDPYVPLTMTLMGGPIDTRENPTVVNKLAETARHRLVPPPRHHQGAVPASGLHARRLSGLPAAQRLRHHEPRPPHRCAPQHVPPSGRGRRRLATKHREFYDEYLAVMDLSAEFYLQTVETVFIRHDLPKGA